MTEKLKMDKESKLPSSVKPFVSKYRSGERMEPQQPPRDSSPPLRLPNPYIPEHRSRGNRAGLNSRQSPSAADGAPVGRGADMPSKHGYSNSRHARGTTDACPHRDRSTRNPQAKTSKYIGNSPQDRVMDKKSLDVPKRGFGGSRSSPSSAGRSKPAHTDMVTFEVKTDDFPELASPAAVPHNVWGRTSSAQSPQMQKPVSAYKTLPDRTGSPTSPHPRQNASDADPVTSALPAGLPTTDAYRHRDRSIRESQAKRSEYSGNSPQDRMMGCTESLDAPKRGLRGSRSAPSSAGRSKPAQTDLVTYEVKTDDFPELAAPVPHNVWGRTSSAQSPQIQKPVSAYKTLPDSRRSPTNPHARQGPSDAHPVPAGEPQTGSSDPVLTSWADIASQPPKKQLPEETVTSTQKGETCAQKEEGASEKKKRRKKKKKPKGASEDVEADSEKQAIPQEPPKLEDEEEFPDLTLDRLITSSNTAKLWSEESKREGVESQSGHQNKDKTPAGKAPPIETAKKEQKAEKVSGKKSKVPVQLDIGNMLAALEKKQQSQKAKPDAKPLVLSVGGGSLPVSQKQPSVQKKAPWQQEKIAHNPLDSTSPLVKKGKQREVPKAKKPTPLKRVILKEREERKRIRAGIESVPANDTAAEEQCDTVATDEITSPAVGLEDQTLDHETSQTEPEGDEGGDNQENGNQQSTQALPSPTNRPKIHTRKFRDYCSQVLNKDVDDCVTTLLRELVRFQDRLYQKDPMKARMKRRLVMGLREVLKHLKLRKVKCVIISPNCERSQAKGGLDEALHTIIDTCREQGVPFVFALSRKTLGRCVNKAVPVSLVGIFNYDGAQDCYHKMMELSSEARKAYEVMVENMERAGQAEEQEEDLQQQPFSSQSLTQEPNTMQPEEPEYIKVWKKMLENECNHEFLNFEEQLSSLCLASECTEQMDEDERS